MPLDFGGSMLFSSTDLLTTNTKYWQGSGTIWPNPSSYSVLGAFFNGAMTRYAEATLPDSVTPTKITVFASQVASAEQSYIIFKRRDVGSASDSGTTIARIDLDSGAGTFSEDIQTSDIVDNEKYQYYFMLSVNGAEGTHQVTLQYVRIDFTL